MEFRPENKNKTTNMDKLRKQVSSLVNKAMGRVEEGLRGMEDNDDVKELRSEFANNLNQIDKSYADSVLETSRLMDKFAKSIDTQQVKISDVLGDNSQRDERLHNNLDGMKEDRLTFQRMGSSRYVFYFLIALVVVVISMFYVNLNMSPYLILIIILSVLFLFIITYFYGK
jgi:ABC-type multidrug transport system fused ATPase/permease subunit